MHPSHRKRHGSHQKHTKPFIKVYLPYLPLTIIVATGLILSTAWQPRSDKAVLAYATNVSTAGLLEETNQQRTTNGKTVLALNSKLNQAAQAKANDMATRNYWSHNTPEGNEPWIFINQVGYVYKQAGENLAYGFDNSNGTVNGWMNSPTHKANLLENTYADVGFGFANSSDYQSTGPQTIVVAMYGTPQVAASTTPATPPPTAAAPVQPATNPPPPAPIASQDVSKQPLSVPFSGSELKTEEAEPVTTLQSPIAEPKPQKVSRIQTLTGGKAPWSLFVLGILSGAAIVFLVLKHGLGLRRMLVQGERFVLHHTLLDVTIVAFIALCTILTRSAGVIM